MERKAITVTWRGYRCLLQLNEDVGAATKPRLSPCAISRWFVDRWRGWALRERGRVRVSRIEHERDRSLGKRVTDARAVAPAEIHVNDRRADLRTRDEFKRTPAIRGSEDAGASFVERVVKVERDERYILYEEYRSTQSGLALPLTRFSEHDLRASMSLWVEPASRGRSVR
jgi:hypothetical protein